MNEEIYVGVEEARNVLVMDSNGFSDPYVVVTLTEANGSVVAAGGTFKTKTIKKTLNPQWHEEFLMGDHMDLRDATFLRCVLYDKDFIGKDECMGAVDIPLAEITGDRLNHSSDHGGTGGTGGGVLDNWYQIHKFGDMKQDARGELRLRIRRKERSTFLATDPSADAGLVAAAASASASASALAANAASGGVPPASGSGTSGGALGAPVAINVAPDMATAPNLLYVTVVSAKDILAMDSNGKSDPLIILKVGNKKHTTSIQEKTLKPHWNEKFSFFCPDLRGLQLSLVMEDHDTTFNDFMGKCEYSLAGLVPHVEKPVNLEFLDKNGRKDKQKPRGSVDLLLLYTHRHDAQELAAKKKEKSMFGKLASKLNIGVPDDDYDSNDEDDVEEPKQPIKSKEELEKEREEREQKRQELLQELSNIEIKSGDYQVQVHVIEARDLRAKDQTGTSDPVVYVDVLQEQLRTKVKKKMLNCVWDEVLIFQLRNLDKEEIEMGFVKLSVMDANTVQRAELIGATQFDLSYVYSQHNHQLTNVWIGLIDGSSTLNEGIQGYLHCSITVLGPGDRFVPPPDPFANATSGPSVDSIIMPPTVSQIVKFFCIAVHEAENLPPMDINILKKNGIDAYVKASIAGGETIRTRVRSKTGHRSELSPSFNEELRLVMREPSMADTVTVGVFDWDQVGQHEVVAHFYPSIKLVKKLDGSVGPFWVNLYGSPIETGGDALLSAGAPSVAGSASKARKQMNKFPDQASTFRGRVLVSYRILANENNEYDEINHKVSIKRLSKTRYPPTRQYVLRAFLVQGSGIPKFVSAVRLGQREKMSIVVSCGMNDLCFDAQANEHGVVKWNQYLEMMKVYPEEEDDIPDVFVYLCKGDGEKRRAVCFKRYKARDLMKSGFQKDVEWISLKEDDSVNDLADDEFPGNFLIRLGFGTKEDAEMNPWDPNMMRHEVNTTSHCQVRVHIYQGRGLPAKDSNGLLDPFIVAKCLDREAKTATHKMTKDPLWYETKVFNMILPKKLKYAPQVALRVMDWDQVGANKFVGTAFINLSDFEARSLDNVLKESENENDYSFPDPKWYPLASQEIGDVEGEILASVELIQHDPGQVDKVPAPFSIVPKKRKAYLDITVLGLRHLVPYMFLPIQLPYIEFVLGAKDHAAQEMITEKCKRPSAADPNFLQRMFKEVELPENALFAPRLNILVRDTRLGGFQKPLIGSASIDMTTKLPWSKNYIPPQSDQFAEIEFYEVDEEGDGQEENSRLLKKKDRELSMRKQSALLESQDFGAGVFGALRSLGVDFDPEEAIRASLAAQKDASDEKDEEDAAGAGDGPRKYLRSRELLDNDVESVLKTTPFEKYPLHIGQKQKKGGLFAGLFGAKVSSEGGRYKVAGQFKGLIRVVTDKDARPLVDIDSLLSPQPYEVRVYVLDGYAFQPMDIGIGGRPGKSDPYLKIQLGKDKVDDRKNYIPDTLEPDFYKLFTFSAMLPGASELVIDAMDHDLIGGDDLIGSTTIDLEDRLFDKRWQAMGEDFENDSHLRPKPLEARTLLIPSSCATMGTLKLWVDILTPAQAGKYPALDISLPPPIEMELRVVIWKFKDCHHSDGLNDPFARCWLEDAEPQETDIHWRAKKGKAAFNWRMKFPVKLGHKQMNSKFPFFHVQLWDKNVTSFSDALGEVTMDLREHFTKAQKLKTNVQFFEDDAKVKKDKQASTTEDEAVRKIKETVGLWDDTDPADAKWVNIVRKDDASGREELKGRVCLSMELVPKEKAQQQPVGFGRSSPNNSPYLPPPPGRLSFSLNPFKVLRDILPAGIFNRLMCCLCCVVVMVLVYFLAPFINLAIVTLK